MSIAKRVKLPDRTEYTIATLMRDVMAIEATPSVVSRIATEILYYEWTCCLNTLGSDHSITQGLDSLIKFMQEEYEQELLEGRLWRAADTPRAAIKAILKTLPKEVLEYTLCRDHHYVHDVLESTRTERVKEIERYTKIEERLQEEMEQSPDDPDLYNQLRLTLWMLGRYREASDAFKKAKALGWTPENSLLVAI
ncbi:MAG: tetratricopeptide repeat protein [Candidatus Thorarchaeota archaeon]